MVDGDVGQDGIRLEIVSTAQKAPCPDCDGEADRIHSHYTRKAVDLACVNQRLQLRLHVRKFFCDRAECPRKIFVERLSPFLEPWARMTTRLSRTLLALGLFLCGRPGARLATLMGLPFSRTSILRRVMKLPVPQTKPSQMILDRYVQYPLQGINALPS